MARDLASDSGADLSKTGDDVREALKNGRAALLRGRMGSGRKPITLSSWRIICGIISALRDKNERR